MSDEIHFCNEIDSKPIDFFFYNGRNNKYKDILIIGESLSKNGWIVSGMPFHNKDRKIAPTFKRLNEELALFGASIENCSFTEVAKCYIGKDRKNIITCADKCREQLLKQLRHYKPKIIITLGVTTKNILEEMFDKGLVLGEMNEVVFSNNKIVAVPLYHPSPANPSGHKKNMTFISNLSLLDLLN